MVTYKDRTFCNSSNSCANTKCDRWLDSEKSRKQDLPVSLSALKSDACGYKPKPIQKAD